MNVKLWLFRVQTTFYMISDNPNDSVGSVDCSLYTRRFFLKYDYHKKRVNMLGYTPIEYNCLETLANTLLLRARQNQFFQDNIFNKAPDRRLGIPKNTSSAMTGPYTGNPSRYQHFNLRQFRILQRRSNNQRL